MPFGIGSQYASSGGMLWVPYNQFHTDAGYVGGEVWASTSADGYPAANLLHPHVRRVWKSGTTEDYVTLSFGQLNPASVTAVFLINHNLTSSNGITLNAWNTIPATGGAWFLPTDDNGDVWPIVPMFLYDSYPYRFWQLSIHANYQQIQIGMIFGGAYIQPTRTIKDGYTVEIVDRSVGDASEGRQGYWSSKTTYRRVTFDLGQLDELTRDRLVATYRKLGTHTPFILSLNAKDNKLPEHPYSDNIMLVQFTGSLSNKHVVNRQFEFGTLTVEEKI